MNPQQRGKIKHYAMTAVYPGYSDKNTMLEKIRRQKEQSSAQRREPEENVMTVNGVRKLHPKVLAFTSRDLAQGFLISRKSAGPKVTKFLSLSALSLHR